MSVRVGFSTPNRFNPVSWLVRRLTRSKASHTWFLYWDSDLEMNMVMEAHELGFRLIPFDHFKRSNTVVALFDPRCSIDVGLKLIAREYLSSRYDFAGLLGMAWVKLGRWLKRKWRNPLQSARHLFCSEALALAMRLSDGYDDFKLDPEAVDPQTMLEYFEQDRLASMVTEQSLSVPHP